MQLAEIDEFNCCVCLQICIRPMTSSCGHSLCQPCCSKMMTKKSAISCPLCRKVGVFKIDEILEEKLSKLNEYRERVNDEWKDTTQGILDKFKTLKGQHIIHGSCCHNFFNCEGLRNTLIYLLDKLSVTEKMKKQDWEDVRAIAIAQKISIIYGRYGFHMFKAPVFSVELEFNYKTRLLLCSD